MYQRNPSNAGNYLYNNIEAQQRKKNQKYSNNNNNNTDGIPLNVMQNITQGKIYMFQIKFRIKSTQTIDIYVA